MVRPTWVISALSVASGSIAALGLVAAGVHLGQGSLSGDPRPPSTMLSRPAAQVVIPPRVDDVPVIATSAAFDSALAPAAPDTNPVPAPGPQSVPAPGPSESPASPAPTPPGPAPAPAEPPVPPLPAPDDGALDPVVSVLGPVVDGLLGGTTANEAGAQTPTSSITSLLGL
ncbi:MAG TPA: hypothetical protein VM345_17680 [Acidimicrobiales bacterium]|nr:hypothetical protein [Acidimicrobiales bacterium]